MSWILGVVLSFGTLLAAFFMFKAGDWWSAAFLSFVYLPFTIAGILAIEDMRDGSYKKLAGSL